GAPMRHVANDLAVGVRCPNQLGGREDQGPVTFFPEAQCRRGILALADVVDDADSVPFGADPECVQRQLDRYFDTVLAQRSQLDRLADHWTPSGLGKLSK